jgi:hypothetical protein
MTASEMAYELRNSLRELVQHITVIESSDASKEEVETAQTEIRFLADEIQSTARKSITD